MLRTQRLFGLAIAVTLAQSNAHAQHLDMMLYREGTELRSGGFNFNALPSVLVDHIVFAENLVHIPVAAPGVAYTSAPGWNALSLPDELPPGGQTLPGNADVYVAGPLLPSGLSGRNLGFWSGIGAPRFDAVVSGEVLVHAVPDPFGGGRFAVYDGGADPAPSLRIGSTGPSGGIHNHPSYAIYGSIDRNAQSADTPATGVYLISLQASMAGFTDARPVFVLFAHGVSQTALKNANVYVRSVVDPTLIPGDANLDGAVNFGDLLTLAQHYESTNATWFDGDFDFDGVVNFGDLLVLAQNYEGQSLVAPEASSAAFNADWHSVTLVVPEPVSLSILAAGLSIWHRRTRGVRGF